MKIKKFVCAVLVLVMAFATVSAFAEDYVDATLKLFTDGRMAYSTRNTITYSILGKMLPGIYCYYVSDAGAGSNVVYEYYDGINCIVYTDEVKDEKDIRIVLNNVILVASIDYVVFYLNSGNGEFALYNKLADANINSNCYDNADDFIAAIK